MPAANNLAPLAAPALRLQSDVRLVGLTRDGQARAFDEIVRRYRSNLVGFATTVVPASRAEDVVQDALAKAYVALDASTTEINLKPWLFTIVRNTALNDLRDEPSHEHLDENWDGVPQPPEVADRRRQLASLIAGIQALPEAQRAALVRRELEGMGHEEIATELGVIPGAVRQLIFRARTTLRDAVGSLIPAPALHAILEADSVRAGAGTAGVAVGLAGTSSLAVKGAVGVLVAGLAVGSGVAIHGAGGGAPRAEIADAAGRPSDRGARATADSQPAAPASRRAGASQDGPPSSGHDSGRGGNEGPFGGGSSGPGGAPQGGSGGGGHEAEHEGGEGHGDPGPGHEEPGEDGGGDEGPGGGEEPSGGDGPGGGEEPSGGGDEPDEHEPDEPSELETG